MSDDKEKTNVVIVGTGEENEDVVHEARSKLFFFFEKDEYGGEVRTNLWKTRGLGQVKILKDRTSGSFRVLMRQEKTLKPVANFGIRDQMKMEFKEGSPKFLLISATDFSDEKPQLRTMGFKFKTDDICAAFKKAFDDAAGSSNQESSKVDDEDDKYNVNDKETWFDLHKILTRPTKWDNASGHCRNPITVKATELRYDESDGCAYPKESFLEVYGGDDEWNNAKPAPSPENSFSHDAQTLKMLATKKVLVIGAGGLGCELLKNLALSGVKNIHVIDADTIDITNLNRQFLFRKKDVGDSKASCAAAFVKRVVPDVNISIDKCFIQNIPNKDTFYKQFDLVVCGLDNLKARKWMSDRLMQNVSFGACVETGGAKLDKKSCVPMIDGGTEGFKGQTHLVVPYQNASFSERVKEYFPERKGVASCTIATNPRKPAHCVIYAKTKLWPKYAQKMVETGMWSKVRDPDSDSRKDMTWIAQKANEHSKKYNLGEITYDFTMGVVKNIIPAIPCSNAMVAASCTVEALKLLTFAGRSMNNYMLVNGDGHSAVTQLEACNHNSWMRNLPLKTILLTSENTRIGDFVNQIGNHSPTNNLLATYLIPIVSFDEDEEEDAREEGKQLVYIFRTDTKEKLAHLWSQETVRVKIGDNVKTCGDLVKQLIVAGSEDDNSFEYDMGSLVLVLVRCDEDMKEKTFQCLDQKCDVGSLSLEEDGVRLVAIPRISCQTSRQAGVWRILLEFKNEEGKNKRLVYMVDDSKSMNKTFKEIEAENKNLVIHGLPITISDSRLKDGRITVYPFITETEQGKAFKNAVEENAIDDY